MSDGLRKDANCYDSFARFVGNYEKDMKTDDDRLLFLARWFVPGSVATISDALHDVDPGTWSFIHSRLPTSAV